MKKMFKKAMTVLSTVAMAGMTISSAFAASYPSPFTSNTAVVVGTGDGVAASDSLAASDVVMDLSGLSTSSVVTSIEGGEIFNLYDTDMLHFGDAINAVMSSDLDDNDLTDALADGTYDSGDIDVDYTQKITLGSNALSLITDKDLNDEEPTIGYHFDSDTVLTYTLSFKGDGAQMNGTSGMAETDFPLFGKDYYVLDATTSKITLLNSAEKVIVSEGETVTIDGHDVSIDYITSTSVKFNVEGEPTDKLSDGDYYELDDEYYIVLSENLYTEKDGAVSKAEISLGSGKVVLENGQEVEVNDDSIDGLTATLTVVGDDLTDLALTWATDGDVFLTEGNSIEMPVFGEFGLVFNGVDFGGTTESISIDNGDVLTLSMGNYDLELMFNDTTEQYLGGEGNKLVTVTATEAPSQEFAIAEDERFLATKLDSDLGDVQTAYFEVQSLNNDSDTFDLSLNDLIGEDDIDFIDASAGDDDDYDDINIKVVGVFDSGDVVPAAINTTYSGTAYVNASDAKALMDFAVLNVSSDGDLHWDKVVSEEGLIVEIPATAGVDQVINFYEAADDGDLESTFSAATLDFNLSTAYDTDDKLYAKVATGATINMVDETVDDKTVGYDAGIHATKIMADSGDHTLEIEYYADEVTADLAIVAGGESSTSSEAGIMVVDDSEVSSGYSKNLIVVGGSAINSVAADLLGGAYRGDTFTSMTGVGAGEALIQSFASPYSTGKVALLVAGYNAADTEKAVTYLLNEDVETTVGTKMKVTSATEATTIAE